MSRPESVGLCLTCRWVRPNTTRRGSTFYRCGRADTDPRFVRYPPLPVLACSGHEATMLFAVLIHYIRPLPEVDAIRAAHIAHIESAAARGIMVAWARRDPPSGGVLIASAPDRATLDAVLAEDPYVKAGVATPEVVSFRPENVRAPLRS